MLGSFLLASRRVPCSTGLAVLCVRGPNTCISQREFGALWGGAQGRWVSGPRLHTVLQPLLCHHLHSATEPCSSSTSSQLCRESLV